MDDRRRRAEFLPAVFVLLTAGAVAIWWALSPDRLAAWWALEARRWGRLLGYVPAAVIVASVLVVYVRWLGPWLGADRPGGRLPDPRGWYARPWFWAMVAALVGLWPPLLSPARIRPVLLTSVTRIVTVLALATWAYVRFVRRTGPQASWGRRAAVNLGLTAIVILWLAGGVECYFRLWPRTDGLGADKLGTDTWIRLHCEFTEYALPPGVAPRGTVRLRDRPRTPDKPAGAVRIAVIGDSVVFGFGVADPADRFTDRLERRLHQERGAEVLNLGISGNDLRGYLEMLRGIAIPFHADLVVLVHNLDNDLLHSTGEPPHRKVEPGGLGAFFLEHSYAVSYLVRFQEVQWQFATSYQDWLVETYNTPRHWNNHLTLLAEFAACGRQAGVRMLFVQHPFLAAVKAYPEGLRAVHARLDEAVRRLGFRSADFLEVFDGQDPADLMVNRRDRHPNERAHRLMADYLYPRLIAALELPPAAGLRN